MPAGTCQHRDGQRPHHPEQLQTFCLTHHLLYQGDMTENCRYDPNKGSLLHLVFSYLEEPLGFWKGRVSSNSSSSGCQLLDNHILLMQKIHQPLAVAAQPAVAMRGPFVPIKLDGLLGHLVLLQHGECARRAEAQQPTYNLHPNLCFCLHPRVEIDKEKETWQRKKIEQESAAGGALLLQRSDKNKKNYKEDTAMI